MSNYGHIKKEFHNLLQLSDEKRIESLYEPIWINYPKTQDIIKLLTSLINRPKILRMQNLLIIGESNMGKTSIISQFTKANPDVVIEDEGNISKAVKPVVLVQFPASADERGLYISIIEQFWTPVKPTDPPAKLRHQAIHLLRECNVKMLILDEVHNLLAGTAVKQRLVMNVLKSLGNELQIPLVAVGTTDAAMILNTDPQLRSRYDTIRLPKWGMDKDFRSLLKSFEQRLPLKEPSNLISKEKATLLFTFSSGNLGDLHRILIDCTIQAITSKKEFITVEIITEQGKKRQQSRVRI